MKDSHAQLFCYSRKHFKYACCWEISVFYWSTDRPWVDQQRCHFWYLTGHQVRTTQCLPESENNFHLYHSFFTHSVFLLLHCAEWRSKVSSLYLKPRLRDSNRTCVRVQRYIIKLMFINPTLTCYCIPQCQNVINLCDLSMTYHRQSAGHRAAIRAERATILVQHSGSILASGHARHIHALQLVRVVLSRVRGGVQRVVRSRGGIVGEMRGQHVVWQGGGSDGRDVEVLIAQPSHWVWLNRERRKSDYFLNSDFRFDSSDVGQSQVWGSWRDIVIELGWMGNIAFSRVTTCGKSIRIT